MIGNRIYIGEQANTKLRSLAQRTKLTPNLLCRVGFCLSVEDATPLNTSLYQDGNAREFNMPTLFGEYQELFLALLRERRHWDSDDIDVRNDPDDAIHLRGHISRGVIQLSLQTKSIEDILAPLESTRDSRETSIE